MMRNAQGLPLKMVVLGSRDQTCVNAKVNRLRSGELNDKCRDMVAAADHADKFGAAAQSEHSCSYYRKGMGPLTTRIAQQPMDIEDLVADGKAVNDCPYFASRQMLPGADIVFAPYNYLVDVAIRRSMKLDEHVRGSVVIVDEAHNIEGVARDAASFERTVDVLMAASKEFNALAQQGPSEEVCEGSRQVCDVLRGLTTWIDDQADKPARVFRGPEVLALWDGAGVCINDESVQTIVGVRAQMDEAFRLMGNSKKSPLSSALASTVDGLLQTLGFLTAEHGRFARDFRVTVTQEFVVAKRRREAQLNVWCLNPAVAFRTLAGGPHAARSIVLTSGTLSPLPALASELGVEFKHQLELMHVVNVDKQVFARVLPRVGRELLDSSYKNAERGEYVDALGQAVLHIMRGVPGGVLLFASSYASVDRLQARWTATGAWAQMEALKPISVEPKGGGAEFDRAVAEYRRNAATAAGAMFLAVFRGKLSEGIDFVDDMCRAVLVLGLPFPSVKDLKVAEKKQYQDERVRAFAQAPKQQHLAPLSGNEWYVQQAYRALNQAIGRVIRHVHDYGCIVFLDQRFMQRDVVEGLSKWVRGAVRPAGSLGELMDGMEDFFKDRRPAAMAAVAAVAAAPARASEADVATASEGSAAEDDGDSDVVLVEEM